MLGAVSEIALKVRAGCGHHVLEAIFGDSLQGRVILKLRIHANHPGPGGVAVLGAFDDPENLVGGAQANLRIEARSVLGFAPLPNLLGVLNAA